MEILIALVPMLAWGSIGLVSGKIGGDANQQTLGMTIGAFLFSLVVFFVVSPVITLDFLDRIFIRLSLECWTKWTVPWNEVHGCFCRATIVYWFSINFEYDCGSRFLP